MKYYLTEAGKTLVQKVQGWRAGRHLDRVEDLANQLQTKGPGVRITRAGGISISSERSRENAAITIKTKANKAHELLQRSGVDPVVSRKRVVQALGSSVEVD